MIEVDLLRYALAAADTGSFSRAASQFGIKQSTLSKRVQHLEKRVGLPLFRRSTLGVVPTDPGGRFLSKARRIVTDVEALVEASRAYAKGDAGVLRLGFCGSLATGDLAATLSDYRAAFPGIEIDAREAGRTGLLNSLERDDLDLAVLSGQAERSGLRSLRFWREPLAIALRADDPLALRNPLFWTDLTRRGFMVTADDPGPDIAAMIMARMAGSGRVPEIVRRRVSRENLASLGTVELIPVLAGAPAEGLPLSGGVAFREVHDAFGPTALDQGIHWRAGYSSPTLRSFLKLVSKRYARPLPKD